MRKRKNTEEQTFYAFCRQWGILPSEIDLLSEEDPDFDEQEEFDYEAPADKRSEWI